MGHLITGDVLRVLQCKVGVFSTFNNVEPFILKLQTLLCLSKPFSASCCMMLLLLVAALRVLLCVVPVRRSASSS